MGVVMGELKKIGEKERGGGAVIPPPLDTITLEKTSVSANITLAAVPEGYAAPLASGYDTIIENFNVKLRPEWDEKLKAAKEYAEELGKRRDAVELIHIGEERFQVSAYGGGGYSYLIKNDDFKLAIGQNFEFCVQVVYSSAGLWEYHYPILRKRVKAVLDLIAIKNPGKFSKISRIDYAFDIYSPDFTEEMRPSVLDGVVSVTRVKTHSFGQLETMETDEAGKIDPGNGEKTFYACMIGGRLETLTVGGRNRLQVQIYDKSREIRQASGKLWMYQMWGGRYEKDVWRIECRFFSKFLREKGIETYKDFEFEFAKMIGFALASRRLSVPTNDSNRSRWPIHPMFHVAAYMAEANLRTPPKGRTYTREEWDRLDMQMTKQGAGILILKSFLKCGYVDKDEIVTALNEIAHEIESNGLDPKRLEKMQKKYVLLGEAL